MVIVKLLLLITVFVSIIAIYCGIFIDEKSKIKPHFFKDGYWGRQVLKDGVSLPKDSLEIRKFVVKIEDSVLEDLKERLQATRYIEPLPNTNFMFGFNGDHLKKVVDYWLQSYDWRKEEQKLNRYNHFKIQIEGIDVHFIYVKAAKEAKYTKPLMLVHGWPGSFVEFYKMIPFLTAVENDTAFELVIPSVPGFGFSEEPHQPGFSLVDTARLLNKLMERMGFQQYYYHGYDYGNAIGRYISAMYPANVLGYHTTQSGITRINLLSLGKFTLTYFLPNLFSEHPQEEVNLMKPFGEKVASFTIRESGYLHIQATKPDTISVALLNSPAGLAAYILEKFSTCINRDYIYLPDGGLTRQFTYDELLTNVMLYWSTIHSSVRIYKELFTNYELLELPVLAKVPAGLSIPPNEILYFPKMFAKQAFQNLLHYNFLPRGGHFAAFEEPELIAIEIRTFVHKCIDFHKHAKTMNI